MFSLLVFMFFFLFHHKKKEFLSQKRENFSHLLDIRNFWNGLKCSFEELSSQRLPP